MLGRMERRAIGPRATDLGAAPAALALLLSACGGAAPTVTATPVERREAEAVAPVVVVAEEAEAPVHPLELVRRELLRSSADTPHYGAVVDEVRARYEAVDLSDAAPTTSAMTCALVPSASPIFALHASGILNWNSSRFDDMEITEEMVADWCAELVALEQTDCRTLSESGSEWRDLCGECREADGPSLEERRRARAHGVAACEAWASLHAHCAEGMVMSRGDALAYVEVTRYEVEAVFESGLCWPNPPDSEPADNLLYTLDRLERLAHGEPSHRE
jgi:hypothetical protein